MDIFIHDSINIALSIVAVLNLLLGLLLIFRAPRNEANKVFSIVIFLVVNWLVSMIFYRGVGGEFTTMWARVLYITASLVPSTFLLFSYLFPRREPPAAWKVLSVFLLNILLILALVHPSWVIREVTIPPEGEKIIKWGLIYPLYVLYISGIFMWAYYILIKRFLWSKGRERLQLKYVIFGTLSTTFLATITNLFLPSLGVFTYNWVGQIVTVLLVGAITYAIVRHRFMNIRLAVWATIFRLLVITVLGGIFYLGSKLFTENLLETTQGNIVFAAVVAAVAVGVFYEPLDKFLRNVTDRLLFQREYNRRELTKQLGKLMAESIDLDEVEKGIRETLRQVMRVKFVKFELGLRDDEVPIRSSLLNYLKANPEILVYDELTRKLTQLKEQEGLGKKTILNAIQSEMAEKNIGVAVPLTATGGVIGALVLGEKEGGDAFTSNDIELLEQLSFQAGVAIENASLFEETKQFNVRLQAEVKKATHDLEERNQRLTVLRKLDHIVLNTLDLQDLAQKTVDLISWEMGFHGGLMALLEQEHEKEILRAMALSTTPTLKKVLQMLPKDLRDLTLDIERDPSNALTRAVKERRPIATDSMEELYSPPLGKKIVQLIQKTSKISYHVVYPLSVKGKQLGVMVFGLPKPYDKLSEQEVEMIEAFLNEVGLAVENVRLYRQLQAANESLHQANIKLKQMDKMKDELVSIASHELRAPMTSIKSYLWMVLNKSEEEFSSKTYKYITRALESSDRMIGLVNDMLSVSRLEGGRIDLERKPEDPSKIIHDVLADLEPKANEKNLELKAKVGEDLPKVNVDAGRIREVLMNLVGNALKFTQEGGVEVGVSVQDRQAPAAEAESQLRQRYVWVSIKDTGKGISKEDIPRLFRKFGRLEKGDFSKMAESQGGTGLGLYISKGIVELHGGKIWAESTPNKGSVFTFSLPTA